MKVGDKVKVSPFITTDTYQKTGKVGVITHIEYNELEEEDGIVTLLFEDDSIGIYYMNCVESLK